MTNSADIPPPAHLLDARGLLCPLPILRARKMLKTLPRDAFVTIIASDPGAIKDFPVFCRQTGATLHSMTQDPDGVIRITLQNTIPDGEA